MNYILQKLFGNTKHAHFWVCISWEQFNVQNELQLNFLVIFEELLDATMWLTLSEN
jgi:hypothetical protein